MGKENMSSIIWDELFFINRRFALQGFSHGFSIHRIWQILIEYKPLISEECMNVLLNMHKYFSQFSFSIFRHNFLLNYLGPITICIVIFLKTLKNVFVDMMPEVFINQHLLFFHLLSIMLRYCLDGIYILCCWFSTFGIHSGLKKFKNGCKSGCIIILYQHSSINT